MRFQILVKFRIPNKVVSRIGLDVPRNDGVHVFKAGYRIAIVLA